MRIGFDAKRTYNNQSGLGNYSRNLLRAFSTYFRDNKYILYTPFVKKALFEDSDPVFETRLPQSFVQKNFPGWWRTFTLSKELTKDKLDIYHGLSHELPFGIDKSKIKSVVTIHDLIFLRHPGMYNPTDRLIYKLKFHYACQIADRIIAVSKQTALDIANYFEIDASKIDIIHQGCNPKFQATITEDTKRSIRQKYGLPESFILFVGNIEKRKNVLALVKAIHIGKINFPLVIVGNPGNYFKLIKKYIDTYSLKNIYFCYSVKNDDLPAIYQLASLFVYPSFFEGFGIPILESLFSKTPVITSKGGCFPEAGGESSLYVDPYNVEELIEAIKKVLNNTALANKMINDGFQHAQNFTSEKAARNVMQVYYKLLDNENERRY